MWDGRLPCTDAYNVCKNEVRCFLFFSFQIRQYQVVGRLIPTEAQPNPPVLRMRLFAANKVLAASRFWYLLRKLRKIKKSHGEILEITEIKEKRPTYVKNFGVWLRYDSRTGTHNMYKEVRDLTQNGAISQIYAEMSGRHRALASSIQVRRNKVEMASMTRPVRIAVHGVQSRDWVDGGICLLFQCAFLEIVSGILFRSSALFSSRVASAGGRTCSSC